jgi:hypothetical protein
VTEFAGSKNCRNDRASLRKRNFRSDCYFYPRNLAAKLFTAPSRPEVSPVSAPNVLVKSPPLVALPLARNPPSIVITTGSIFVMMPELIPDFSLSEETRVLIPLEPNTWLSKLFPVSVAAGLASDAEYRGNSLTTPQRLVCSKCLPQYRRLRVYLSGLLQVPGPSSIPRKLSDPHSVQIARTVASKRYRLRTTTGFLEDSFRLPPEGFHCDVTKVRYRKTEERWTKLIKLDTDGDCL